MYDANEPCLYLANIRGWLSELAAQLGRPATLDDIPDAELAWLGNNGITWLALSGIWQQSKKAMDLVRADPKCLERFSGLLPDFRDSDVTSSPFALTAYVADGELVGSQGLSGFRERLLRHGMRLMLDFVSIHTALDHPWVEEHPEYYIRGTEFDLQRAPRNYCQVTSKDKPIILAHGRDPNFPGWRDSLQLDYGQEQVHEAMMGELSKVAELCDGVRCHMAMLLIPSVFQRTWGTFPEPFWPAAIRRVHQRWPNLLFLGESYWGLEPLLERQGFDYLYDKTLCDRLQSGNATSVRDSLGAPPDSQRKFVRFLENDSEARAAGKFAMPNHCAAAVLTYTAPGMHLFHRGQFEGRRIKFEKELSRQPEEAPDLKLREFYEKLLKAVAHPAIRNGVWRLLAVNQAWADNPTSNNFVAAWRRSQEGKRLLVVVNYGNIKGQCYVNLPFSELSGQTFKLTDLLSDRRYLRDGEDLAENGLFLDVPAFDYHIFEFEPAAVPVSASGRGPDRHLLEKVRVLSGHEGWVNRIAWSPDGSVLASASNDKTVRIWGWNEGNPRLLAGHADKVMCVAWKPTLEGSVLASSAADGSIVLWNLLAGEAQSLAAEHTGAVHALAWSPDGTLLASAGADGVIWLWDAKTRQAAGTLNGHRDAIFALAWSQQGRLASGGADQTIRIWNPKAREIVRELPGASATILCLAWLPHSQDTLVSGATDSTVRIWDAEHGGRAQILEMHTGDVRGVAFSPDGLLLASKAADNTVRLWRTGPWELIETLQEPHAGAWLAGVDFNPDPDRPLLAAVAGQDLEIRIWKLNRPLLWQAVAIAPSIKRITAKVVLVGEAGVGKSGLGWTLANGTFRPQEATHGQKVWMVDQLRSRLPDDTEREAVLWDFAGQPDYRLIHVLFIDDAHLAIVVMDPTKGEEALPEIDYWLKQLSNRPTGPCRCILVGGRTDVGLPRISQEDLEAFCEKRGITGGYISTSAKNGDGLKALLDRIAGVIDWDKVDITTTTQAFDDIKKFVTDLKSGGERDFLLTDPAALHGQMRAQNPDWGFTVEDTATSLKHLAKHGFVAVLPAPNTPAREMFLLMPELFNNLAASILLEARRAGSLDESKLRGRGYELPELRDLRPGDQNILLDAATILFLRHNLCFRESIGPATLLVFPDLINVKRPAQDNGAGLVEGVAYEVSGAVQNLYPTLVVLLSYTNVFTKTTVWQNQAQYELEDGICGFRKTDESEGRVTFVLHFSQDVKPQTRDLFQGLFQRILDGRKIQIKKVEPRVCGSCGSVQPRASVLAALKTNKTLIYCYACGKPVDLKEADEGTGLTVAQNRRVQEERMRAETRTRVAAALVSLKSLRNPGAPAVRCFVSYAHDTDADLMKRVERLVRDLKNSGIEVLFDRWQKVGNELHVFAEQIVSVESVIVVGTPAYLHKHTQGGSYVAVETHMIGERLRQKKSVLPVLLAGSAEASLPPGLQGRSLVDLREEHGYFQGVFNLLVTLFGLQLEDPLVDTIRQSIMFQGT